MNPHKAVKFVKEVFQRTEKGLITWEPTSEDDRFEASYPNQSLAIYEATEYDHDTSEEYQIYILALINSSGRIVSSVRASELSELLDKPYDIMRQMYVMARDKALGVDDELEKLFSNFERSAPTSDDSKAAPWNKALMAVNAAAHIAASLNNLGNKFSADARHEDALAATEQATESDHQLAVMNIPDLAISFMSLSNKLSAIGQHDDALEATEQATDLYRRLAIANATHEPDLAMSLMSLGNKLSAIGRHDDALEATEQATDLYRRLAMANVMHEPDLAMSLMSLGNKLSAINRHDDALTATEMATHVYHRLAAVDAARYKPILAAALNNLGNKLSTVGRQADALTVTEEAKIISRMLE